MAKTQRKPRGWGKFADLAKRLVGWGKFADLAKRLVKVPKSEVIEPKKPKRRKK
ncbi:MAG: hypothetical protein KGO96_12665 [Elusimicrobia bacterium]|nr:hypothetical protein [Elusimicrobiota bacterium]